MRVSLLGIGVAAFGLVSAACGRTAPASSSAATAARATASAHAAETPPAVVPDASSAARVDAASATTSEAGAPPSAAGARPGCDVRPRPLEARPKMGEVVADPECEWRIEDTEEPTRRTPGVEWSDGRVAPATLAAALESKRGAVLRCTRDVRPPVGPVLRVRVVFDANGRLAQATVDYAVSLPDPVRTCVVGALENVSLSNPASAVTAVYGFVLKSP